MEETSPQLVVVKTKLSCVETILPTGLQSFDVRLLHIRRCPLEDGEDEILGVTLFEFNVPTVSSIGIILPALQQVFIPRGGTDVTLSIGTIENKLYNAPMA